MLHCQIQPKRFIFEAQTPYFTISEHMDFQTDHSNPSTLCSSWARWRERDTHLTHSPAQNWKSTAGFPRNWKSGSAAVFIGAAVEPAHPAQHCPPPLILQFRLFSTPFICRFPFVWRLIGALRSRMILDWIWKQVLPGDTDSDPLTSLGISSTRPTLTKSL